MKSFTILRDTPAVTRTREHGGENDIHFRRLWSAGDFHAPIDFVDYTIIPPKSTIGYHAHIGNEEAYVVMAGTPIVRVQNDARRLARGDIAVVHSGESHELINDSDADVEILVFQVRLPGESGGSHERDA